MCVCVFVCVCVCVCVCVEGGGEVGWASYPGDSRNVSIKQHDRQCTYNVTLMRVRAIDAVEKQCYIF